MRQTKVDYQTGLIGAHRKIKQTRKGSPVVLPLTRDESKAVREHLRIRKADLLLRRKDWMAQLVPLGRELGAKISEEATLPDDVKLPFTSFVGMLKKVAGGEQYLAYTAEEAGSYWKYLDWMNGQIDDLFEMTRLAREEK